MGSNVAIPCVLLAPINQSDDSIYWKAPSGEIEVNSTNVSTNLSADLACQVFGREGSRVFAVRESQYHYSPVGTLRRHSLVLYVCDATMREKGAYSCGVQDNGTTFLATTLLSVQESIAGMTSTQYTNYYQTYSVHQLIPDVLSHNSSQLVETSIVLID